MIAMLSIALLSSSATYVADTKTTIDNYTKCLNGYSREQLALKTESTAFRKAVQDVCVKERDIMIAQTISDEMSFDSTRAEATQFAKEEVDGTISKISDEYADHLIAGTIPSE